MTSDFYENESIGKEEQDVSVSKAFGKLIPFLKVHKKALGVCLGLLVSAKVLTLTWPVLLQKAIDGPIREQLTLPPAVREFAPLLYIGLVIVGMQVFSVIFEYLMRVRLETIGQNVMLALKRRLFEHILSLDISFFDKQPVGRLMARVESDTESLRLLFTNTVVLVIGDVLLVVGIYSILFYYDWKLALVLLLFIPVLALLIYIFHKLTTHRFLEVRKRMAEVTASLTEFLAGMSIVQIFHRGDYARRRVYHNNQRKFTEDAFANMSVTIFFNILFYFEWVKIGLVLLLGSIWGITAGKVIMIITLIWKEFDPIARTADQLGVFQKGIAGARRIFALLRVQPKVLDPANPVEWPGLNQAIRFENVWFSYTDDENWVLRDVSFEIPAGKRIALAGVTGGGKSTVINLLLRMYDPQKGRITIDGVDLRDLRLADLRKQFALVLQDIILFPGDVASNIGLESESISRERIESAAGTVAADDFIRRLDNGYETEVSERGSNFSRGERQLLSFARALAIDPEVLILDEATSSVDPETERTIQGSLKKLMTGRTSLIIAHRLSTILDVDQILVIRKGEIIERGTHTELILADGYYSKLFHLQFKHKNGVAPNAG